MRDVGLGVQVDFEVDGPLLFAAALGVLIALEPAVDHGLGDPDGLHMQDSLGAGVGFATVVDEFVEVPGGMA